MSDFQPSVGFPSDNTAAVVLFSGGMDSTLALMRARATHTHVAALMVDYGQPHRDAELCAAGKILHALEVPGARICVADALAVLRPADRMANAPHVEGAPHPAEVPGRNALMLAFAMSHGRVWWPPGQQRAWEPPRVVTEATPHRRARLKALGNAVVPHQALMAWRILVLRMLASEAA